MRELIALNQQKGVYLVEAPGDDGPRKLYVVEIPGGVSSVGVEVAQRWCNAVRKWLGEPPSTAKPGTIEAYEDYMQAMRRGQQKAETGKVCQALLEPKLRGYENKWVAILDPDGEQPPQIGMVGKSTGWMPVHLLIASSADCGGEPVFLPPRAVVVQIAPGQGEQAANEWEEALWNR